jgi:hypothetical protein
VSVQARIDLAARRTEWAARSLAAAANELHAASAEGAAVDSTAAAVAAESRFSDIPYSSSPTALRASSRVGRTKH